MRTWKEVRPELYTAEEIRESDLRVKFDVFMESLNGFTDDFLPDGRPAQLIQPERVNFD